MTMPNSDNAGNPTLTPAMNRYVQGVSALQIGPAR